MGKLLIESNEPILMPKTKSDSISDFLSSRSSSENLNIKEIREAIVMFEELAKNNLNSDGTITYNGRIYTKEELYDELVTNASIIRRKMTDQVIDDYFKQFDILSGTIILNGVTIDVISDMKERAYRSYDPDTKTVEYLPNIRISLNELYLKYRKVNTEEQNTLTNTELCEDMLSYLRALDPDVVSSTIQDMNITFEEYMLNKLPLLMQDGTYVEIEGNRMPIEVFVTRMYEHQVEFLKEEKKKEEEELEAKLNRTKENPDLVGLINVALNNNNSMEVTTEMPLHNSSKLDDDEISSIMESSNISSIMNDYYFNQLSTLKVSINGTTNDTDLKFNESVFNDIVSGMKDTDKTEEVLILIESIQELITEKRNGFIKTNINSEDLIDITHGIINDWENELNGATSADDYNKIYGKVTALILDLKRKGIRDIQLEAKIITFKNKIAKRRVIFDSTLTNISQELQKIKFELDEKMKRIRKEILAVELNKPSKSDITGKTIMIESLIDDARRAVRDAATDINTEFSKESVNYYNSQLEMYSVAINNMSQMGYGQI